MWALKIKKKTFCWISFRHLLKARLFLSGEKYVDLKFSPHLIESFALAERKETRIMDSLHNLFICFVSLLLTFTSCQSQIFVIDNAKYNQLVDQIAKLNVENKALKSILSLQDGKIEQICWCLISPYLIIVYIYVA